MATGTEASSPNRPDCTLPPWQLVGLGVFTVWGIQSDACIRWVGQALPWGLASWLDPIAYMVALVAFVLACGTSSVKPTAGRALGAAGIAGSMGMLLAMAVPLMPQDLVQVGFAAVCLVSACSRATIILAWMTVYARLPYRSLLISYALSLVVLTAANQAMALVGLFTPALWVLRMALPPCCALLAYASQRRVPLQDDPPCPATRTWSFPIKPVLLFIAYTFVVQLTGGLLPAAGAGQASMAGNALTALVLLAVGLSRHYSFELSTLYRTSLPLVLCALLCSLVATDGTAALAAHMFSGIGYACFITFATLLLCTICARYGVNPVWLLGITLAARVPVKPIADMVAGWAHHAPEGESAVLVIAVGVGLVTLCMFCGSDKDYRNAWGMRPTDHDRADAPGPTLDDLERRCTYLSRECALTRREEDVLGLLVRGMSVPEIERVLSISRSTAKTHVHRIYVKLDVHTRDELFDRFGQGNIPDNIGQPDQQDPKNTSLS